MLALSKNSEPLHCRPWKAKNMNTKQLFGSKKKKLNGNIFVELSSSDVDEKMYRASYKRERNKNKEAQFEADNLFNLFTMLPLSRTC